jgi:hypothetical protein
MAEAKDDKTGNGSSWMAKLGGGLAIVIVVVVISALSGLHLEISVSKPESLQDISSFQDLGKLIGADLDFGQTGKWEGYIGESRGQMHHIEEIALTLKQLSKNKRVVGTTQSRETGDEFSVVGFLGSHDSVFVDLGKTAGFGAYILKPGANEQISGPMYFGYVLVNTWRDKPGGEMLIDKCPLIIIDRDVAEKNHMDANKMADMFGFLQTPCSEFKMPMSLVDVDKQ